MDTDLVILAQHGDREAFGLVAADLATRFLAVSRRILRDIDLAEDCDAAGAGRDLAGPAAASRPGAL